MKQANIQTKYLRRARIVAAILQFCPFVRMVMLNGSVTQGTAKESSDIDFLIITKKDRLWAGRAFTTLFVQLTGLRRYGTKIAGRICLNRYQTEDYLQINPLTAKNAQHHSSTIILFSCGSVADDFIKANVWMKRFAYKIQPQRPKQNILARPIQFFSEAVFDLIFNDWGEEKLGQLQKKKIQTNPLTKKSPLGAIFVSDKELRFHPPKNLDKNV